MANLKLASLLSSVLGRGYNTSGDNKAYHCPFCNHHKRKLEINLSTHRFQCWVCNIKGRSLLSLFKRLKVAKNKFDELTKLVAVSDRQHTMDKFIGKREAVDILSLPDEYKPLWIPDNSIEYKNAIFYLSKRGVTPYDIMKYRIGYCESGEYNKMVIIPSYDASGSLNYFVGRSYYTASKFKHKNPKVSKDIVGFEMFVNWDMPIVIVEGSFDAITVKRNAIPLYGKTIPEVLRKKIIDKKVKEIYICLDKDAIKNAVKFAEQFLNAGLNVYFVELGIKDPSELGFDKITKRIIDTKPLTLRKLVEYKLFA